MSQVTRVLTVDVWYRVEDGRKVQYRKGDTVKLSEDEVEFLTDAGAVADAGSDEGKAAQDTPSLIDLDVEPEAAAADQFSQASYAAARSNSALDQLTGTVAEGDVSVERPPKSATVEVWRAYAVAEGKVTEAEAAELTKAELQEITE